MPAFLCAPGLDLDGLLALCVLEQAQSGTDDFTGVVVAAAAIDATTQRLRRPAPPGATTDWPQNVLIPMT